MSASNFFYFIVTAGIVSVIVFVVSSLESVNLAAVIPSSSTSATGDIVTIPLQKCNEPIGGTKVSKQQDYNSTLGDSVFVTLNRDDHIYKWFPGHPPIVVESHKLIFFDYPKVATTTWKKLFRRMEGHNDWKTANPHVAGGLVHLAMLNISYAEKILNSPDYTRAIIVRDPKDRFVSAWLDKAKAPGYLQQHCCKNGTDCPFIENAQKSITDFVELAKICRDRHWNPYTVLTDTKWLSKISFVGHFESLEDDARTLLKNIGAWDDFGATGWGLNGDEHIFSSRSDGHSTSQNKSDSWDRLSKILNPQTEKALEDMYADDYNAVELELSLRRVFGSCP